LKIVSLKVHFILSASYLIFYFIDQLVELNEEDENEIPDYDNNEHYSLIEKDGDNDEVEQELFSQLGK